MRKPKDCTRREFALDTWEEGYREGSTWLAYGVARELGFDQEEIREIAIEGWERVFGLAPQVNPA